ncbi:hypothetical protein COOONC_05945 [Cooperia oncophora]
MRCPESEKEANMDLNNKTIMELERMWCWRLIVLAVAISAEEEHFLDVKQIVKGRPDLPVLFSPDADVSVLYRRDKQPVMQSLPIPQQNTSAEGEKNPEDFYRLFQLPADIMTKLAEDAGYIDPRTTTSGPWIVRR